MNCTLMISTKTWRKKGKKKNQKGNQLKFQRGEKASSYKIKILGRAVMNVLMDGNPKYAIKFYSATVSVLFPFYSTIF